MSCSIIIVKKCHKHKERVITGFESITARTEHDDKKDEKRLVINLPYEQSANALMSAKGYTKYIEKHGYHFTNELAEHASKMMVNANSSMHSWSAAQVKKSMESLGLVIPEKVTLGDVTYLANMYYADLYPDPLKDEASCFKAAYKITNDPDGYKGMIFCRWTTDAIGKAINIDWEKFI